MSNVNISPTLLGFLDILKGTEISTNVVEDINKGKLDLLVGQVAAQTYAKSISLGNLSEKKDPLTSKMHRHLTQVTIRTDQGESYTLSDNKNFQLNSTALGLENADLIIRPRIIYVQNIEAFSENFQDAAKYGQRVGLIYDRVCNYIILVSAESNRDLISKNTRSAVDGCYRWGCDD